MESVLSEKEGVQCHAMSIMEFDEYSNLMSILKFYGSF